jgi:cation transport regulator
VFALFGRQAVAIAGVSAGDRVLDLAAGRGANLFAAAEVVGLAGRAIGVDLAAAMVDETAREIQARGLGGLGTAEMLQMDAEALSFADATFDIVRSVGSGTVSATCSRAERPASRGTWRDRAPERRAASMPYKKNSDLPESVRDHLPPHAQDIYRETFNSAEQTYADPTKRTLGGNQEEAARRAAWASVKHEYKKDPKSGDWVPKADAHAQTRRDH